MLRIVSQTLLLCGQKSSTEFTNYLLTPCGCNSYNVAKGHAIARKAKALSLALAIGQKRIHNLLLTL